MFSVEKGDTRDKSSRSKLFAVLGLAALGGIPLARYCLLDEPLPSEQRSSRVEHTPSNAELMAGKITQIEGNFVQLEAELRTAVAAMPQDAIRLNPEILWAPFRLVGQNRNNSRKNALVWNSNHSRARAPGSNLNYFSYNFLPETASQGGLIVAGLSNDGASLYLQRDFAPDSRRVLLQLHHELVHKWQVLQRCRALGVTTEEEYVDHLVLVENALQTMGIQNLVAGTPITLEIEAYASEVEVLNILTHDRLRVTRGQISEADFAAILPPHPSDSHSPNGLSRLELARAYYQDTADGGSTSAHFSHTVARFYRQQAGLPLYAVLDTHVVLLDENMNPISAAPLVR